MLLYCPGLVSSASDAARLSLLYEPEAASLYSPSHEQKHKSMGGELQPPSAPALGSTLLVVDAGGGTVDMTLMKVRVADRGG